MACQHTSNKSPHTSNPAPFLRSLPLPEVRQHLVDLVPENVGVVGLVKMAELMSHDVIDDGLRGYNALPVKGKPHSPAGCQKMRRRSGDGVCIIDDVVSIGSSTYCPRIFSASLNPAA
jgi:hypothetical protein